MRIDMPSQTTGRRRARAALTGLGTTALLVALTAAPAAAAPPETSFWEESSTSTLHFLLVLFGIPAAIIAVLALLVYLPSMVRGQSSEPALVFAQRSEWFGGRRKTPGVDDVAAERQPTGGAGAQW